MSQSPFQPQPQHVQQTIVVQGAPQSQALPALVNFMCFPGLGHLIQGRPIAALIWWVVHLLAALSCFIGVGFILWPIVWIACTIDAARYNPSAYPQHQPPSQTALIGVGAFGLLMAMSFLFCFGLPILMAIVSPPLPDPVAPAVVADRSGDGTITIPDEQPTSEPSGAKKESPKDSTDEVDASIASTAIAPATLPSAKDSSSEGSDRPSLPPPPREVPPLVIESWRFYVESGFVHGVGEVTNTTDEKFEALFVIMTFYDSAGEVVKTSEAVVDFNPLLPGQTSPFTVIDTNNPAIESATVAFKTVFGRRVNSMSRDKLNEPTPEQMEYQREQEEVAARAAAELEAARLAKIENAKWRTWTAASGKFSTEAKFISFGAGKVTLEKRDGKVITVDLEILCEADESFIRNKEWLKAAETLP